MSRLEKLAWRALMAGAAALAAFAAAGQDVMVEGRKLFNGGATPACALCHTLKDAGATAEIGPSLDELKPDAARIEKAVRNGLGVMPANTTLSDAQLRLLAQYVARASGGAK